MNVSNHLVTSTTGAPEAPIVSVVIATYNRPAALRHAIQSVIDNAFTDWELIVVGDACTDDTAACVAAFNDSRIRFVNLPVRCGYQSGPNNHGVELARGRYVAFLNHDDLYLPDHLAMCVAELDASGADFVWVPTAMAVGQADAASASGKPYSFALSGVPVFNEHAAASQYWPSSFYFASSWVFQRSLAARVGPWLGPRETYLLPSQEWLFRAWRRGATMRFVPGVSVIALPAGFAPGSYARRESPEHDRLVQWIKSDPKYRERILEEVALSEAMQRLHDHAYPPWRTIRRMLFRPLYTLLLALGIHPQALYLAIRSGPRGKIVRDHRQAHGAD